MNRLFLSIFLSPLAALFGQVQIATFEKTTPSPPPFPLMAPATYALCWDIDMSPYAGGEDLLFGTRILETAETAIFSKSSAAYSQSMVARTLRLCDLFLVWLPLNYLAAVVQHEVFGHGYRIRDINGGRAEVFGYSIGGPPPYGEGRGATYYGVGEEMTTTQESSISIAGVESSSILAQLTKLKWLEASTIDPRQAILYLLAEQDLTLYIGTLKTKGIDLSGHDIHCYIQSLNQTYPDKLLSKGRLSSLAWINLADPFTFYSLYALFRYLSSGKETPIPMIADCYLPGLRLGLTPFGPEVFLDNYFLYKNKAIYGYVKGGSHARNQYYGIGVFVPYAYSSEKWHFGCRIDLWRQPKLLLSPGAVPFFDIDFDETPRTDNPLYSSSERHAVRYGGAASALIGYSFSKAWGMEAELGYKAGGFLPGYSLYAAPTARLSYTLKF